MEQKIMQRRVDKISDKRLPHFGEGAPAQENGKGFIVPDAFVVNPAGSQPQPKCKNADTPCDGGPVRSLGWVTAGRSDLHSNATDRPAEVARLRCSDFVCMC